MFIFRFIEGLIVKLLLLIILTGVILFFAKDKLLKYYIDTQLAKETGLSMTVEKVHMDPFKGVIVINNVTIYHPTIMNNLLLAQVDHVEGKIGIWNLFFKKINFDWLEIDISLFQSIESKSGVSTEVYMKKLAENVNLQAGSWIYEGIDQLYLTIGKHQKIDLENPEKIRWLRELNINRMSFKDVETPGKLLDTVNKLLYK